MKNKILQEFLNSDIKIKSQEKLEQYIDYCIVNNQVKRIKNEEGLSKSSHHHILPEALFPQYSNLRENPWNGTYLMYSDHYYAHWLLTEAIDDYGQLYAFTCMHNKDTKNGRITEEDLIPADEFQLKIEERTHKMREWYSKKDEKGTTNSTKVGIKISKSKEGIDKSLVKIRFLKTINKELDEEGNTIKSLATKKMIKTINEIKIVNGICTSIAKEGSKKAAITMKDKGIYVKAGKKNSKTRNKKRYVDGKMTTSHREGTRKSNITKERKSRRFNIINALTSEIVKFNILRIEVVNLCQGLLSTTKEKYLGLSKRSYNNLKKRELLYLNNCYLEEI